MFYDSQKLLWHALIRLLGVFKLEAVSLICKDSKHRGRFKICLYNLQFALGKLHIMLSQKRLIYFYKILISLDEYTRKIYVVIPDAGFHFH